ncbi:MAG: hypothetical protein QM523_01840 [Candidatus Pacebacteria bacterium]|nr:hypothetical protein [Candidatus Paceibacterota bacterium]
MMIWFRWIYSAKELLIKSLIGINQNQREGWATKLDTYSVAAGIAIITHVTDHLDLSSLEVLGLIVSIGFCEVISFILRKVQS